MAIHRVTVNALYREQSIVNRWYYISEGTPAAVSRSFGLYSAFGRFETTPTARFPPGTVLAPIAAFQTDLLRYVNILVENLYDPADFYDTPYPVSATGEVDSTTIEDLGPLVALGFRTSRVTRAIRRGQKRISGMTQDGFTGGGFATAGAATNIENIRQAMTNVLTYVDEGNTLTYTPAILSFKSYTTPAGNTAYEKWPTEAEQLSNSATGFIWEPYQTLRSQNSRQYGRGS